jgi:hypothetical protein
VISWWRDRSCSCEQTSLALGDLTQQELAFFFQPIHVGNGWLILTDIHLMAIV